MISVYGVRAHKNRLHVICQAELNATNTSSVPIYSKIKISPIFISLTPIHTANPVNTRPSLGRCNVFHNQECPKQNNIS